MFNYDSTIITIIMLLDGTAVWLGWQCLQQKRQQLIKRQVTKVLRKLGITSNV